jgi:hypothetical protein
VRHFQQGGFVCLLIIAIVGCRTQPIEPCPVEYQAKMNADGTGENRQRRLEYPLSFT